MATAATTTPSSRRSRDQDADRLDRLQAYAARAAEADVLARHAIAAHAAPEVAAICDESLGHTSKHGRPSLTLMVADLGTPTGLALRAAAAVTLVHNATIVLDDSITGNSERRGGPSIPTAHGIGVAVLIGTAYSDGGVVIAPV